MERTIDGIDYIAKSEVLRIIDEDIDEAKMMSKNPDVCEDHKYGWLCRVRALETIRACLLNPESR